jgi:predicted nucleic-acid-binding Zn-ribbon protein
MFNNEGMDLERVCPKCSNNYTFTEKTLCERQTEGFDPIDEEWVPCDEADLVVICNACEYSDTYDKFIRREDE